MLIACWQWKCWTSALLVQQHVSCAFSHAVGTLRRAQVSAEMGSQYSEVLSAQDVAVYGGLCALASFDRGELRRHVINNFAFQEFLELSPEVRAIASLPLPVTVHACM